MAHIFVISQCPCHFIRAWTWSSISICPHLLNKQMNCYWCQLDVILDVSVDVPCNTIIAWQNIANTQSVILGMPKQKQIIHNSHCISIGSGPHRPERTPLIIGIPTINRLCRWCWAGLWATITHQCRPGKRYIVVEWLIHARIQAFDCL